LFPVLTLNALITLNTQITKVTDGQTDKIVTVHFYRVVWQNVSSVNYTRSDYVAV